ncbi:MAG: type II toxin-antitoxin system prevent-host-death family antitoxin [Candidatus Rokubacteria bacterium]|nr:type II toxin-antitoxin system prevent-host-death family antitoxin [Candidatus Rokubacteria bacterium]
MRRAKISELRNHLSRYLDQVRRGETIEVVDRNIPVARVVPVTPGSRGRGEEDRALIERLLRSGHVRSGPLKGVPEIVKRLPPGPVKSGVLDALLSERRVGR